MAKNSHRGKGDKNMALTRKFLTAMGVEGEKIDEIINAHSETVEALKDEVKKYKEEAEANSEAKEKVDELQKKVDELTKEVEKNAEDGYKEKYDSLKEEYDDYKKTVSADKEKQAKTEAYKKLLKESGVSEKRIDSVLKVSDIDSLKIDKDGTLEGIDDLKKKITEEWADFIEKAGEQGAKISTPPKDDNGGNSSGSSYAVNRVQQYRANLYGALPESK
jgi:dsDNA-specific endonuclease/ATPase MutS2